MEKVLVIVSTLCKKTTSKKTQILHRIRLLENKTPKDILKTNMRKPNGKLTILLLYRRMIYTHLHGKQNSEDTCLIFLLSTLTPMLVILMKITPKEQILFLFRGLICMIQTMVKTGKVALFLTHQMYLLQILNCIVKVNTLKSQQTYKTLLTQHKHLSQTQTMIRHTDLCSIHRRGTVTPLRRL